MTTRLTRILGAPMAVAVVTTALVGCAEDTTCPVQRSDLDDPDLAVVIGTPLVAGTGIVQRYVDTDNTRFRGYDVQITSRVAGLAEADQVMFVAAESPIPGIELGAEVLVVGQRGPMPAEIRSSGCPALVPLRAEDEPSSRGWEPWRLRD
jgi:hypothetical protein